jgi:hypothetical protein
LIHITLCQQIDEHIPYEEFSLNMKELNDEQKLIMEEILHKKLNIKKNLYTFFQQEVYT